jgi:putative ABC transport system permease protein
MSLWRQLTRGLSVLTRRAEADREVADEVSHYLEEVTAELVASGVAPDEARRAARLEVGNVTAVTEEIRAAGWENWIEVLLSDLQYGLRRLRRDRTAAAVSALTLAVGIGATAAIFGAVNPILFEPLPYPHPERLAMIWDANANDLQADVAFGSYRELLARSRSFDSMAVMKPWQPTLTGPAEPERLDGQRVSAGFLQTLGVAPLLGRDFQASDDVSNGPLVVILSDKMWRRRFAGDPSIVGRPVTLDGVAHTVIGVMPGAFENLLAPSADIWAPLQYDLAIPQDGREWGHHLRLVARLRPGVRLTQATEELAAIARHPVPEFARPPWASMKRGVTPRSLHDDVTRAVRPALVAVLGAVLLVLAIACVNVTNLQLALGARRRGEFALRAALGAPRTRVVRQMLTESLLLAGIGGVLGVVVAAAGARVLANLSPPGLPRVEAIGLDGAVLAFGFVLTTLIVVAVGVVPAVYASRSDLQAGLQLGSPRTAGGHFRTRKALVVAEVALACVLLVGAGLLLRSLQRLFAVAPGFDAGHVITMQVQTSGARFDAEMTQRFFDDALDAVRRVPGVAAAGFTSQLPLSGDFDRYGVQFESSANDRREDDQAAYRYAVSPGYFDALGIPLLRGRVLDARDTANAPVAVLISESLAARRFPRRDPVGQRLHVGRTDLPWYTIAGVVGNVKQVSLALNQPDAVYIPTAQWYATDSALWLVVRAHGDPAALTPAIKRAVWSVDKDQPIVRVSTLEDRLAASAAERRFALVVFEAFGIVALILAAIGIYGVLSGSVAERTHEIGVRCALGASRRRILALVLGQGMTLTGYGVAIGLTAALVASAALVSLLFGTSRLDLITHLAVMALVAAISIMACWLPAKRAASVDPSVTLRAG